MANTYRLYSTFFKQKKAFTNEKTSCPTGLAWYTNRTAVSLFGNINVAAITDQYCTAIYRISSDQYMYIVHFSKCIYDS